MCAEVEGNDEHDEGDIEGRRPREGERLQGRECDRHDCGGRRSASRGPFRIKRKGEDGKRKTRERKR